MNDHSAHQDRPLLGILLMLGFCVLAPLGDAVAKLLSGAVPLGQLVFIRFAIQALILIPIVIFTSRPWRTSGRVFKLVVWRTLLHIAGIAFMFTALRHLPLADAVAIAFVMPFLMLILGKYILNEEVGIRRLMACVVGFTGTLMVIQPSFVEVGAPALLPLGVAVIFALFMLVTRQIAKDTDPIGIQAVSGVLGSTFIAVALFVGQSLEWPALSLSSSGTQYWGLLLAIGVIGTAAHLLMTWSLRYAPPSTLASMQYLEIPIAALIGWLVFGDWPNGLGALGICITMAAGLYVVFRERATLQASQAAS